MDDDERAFLIAEFEQAWAMVLSIDDRRFRFVEYYSAVFTAILTAASALVSWHGTVDASTATPLSALLLIGVLVGLTFVGMLKSERTANIRYRKKINLLREMFLKDSGAELIQDYVVNHEDLGIKLFTDKEQPSGVGSTLTGVFRFLYIEIGVLVVAVPALWLVVLLDG